MKAICHVVVCLFFFAPLAAFGGRHSIPPGLSWDWNLEGEIPTSKADIIDYDPKLGTRRWTEKEKKDPRSGFQVQRNGAKYVICYFSAGSWELGRADMAHLRKGIDYGEVMKGGNQGGSWQTAVWQEGMGVRREPERWLNIGSDKVKAVMVARMVEAYERGCDAVEPDNLDGDIGDPDAPARERNFTGFNKSLRQTLAYLTFLSQEAERIGIGIGLKNADDLVPQVVDKFDFVIVEECLKKSKAGYEECKKYQPFLTAKKAVLIAEYGAPVSWCNDVKKKYPGMSLTRFPKDQFVKNGQPCR